MCVNEDMLNAEAPAVLRDQAEKKKNSQCFCHPCTFPCSPLQCSFSTVLSLWVLEAGKVFISFLSPGRQSKFHLRNGRARLSCFGNYPWQEDGDLGSFTPKRGKDSRNPSEVQDSTQRREKKVEEQSCVAQTQPRLARRDSGADPCQGGSDDPSQDSRARFTNYHLRAKI